MNNVVSLRFTGERARQPKGGSNGQALSVWNPETTQPDGQRASNQRSFERLEAENARRGFPCLAKSSACASFVAISTFECLFLLSHSVLHSTSKIHLFDLLLNFAWSKRWLIHLGLGGCVGHR